MKKLIFIICLLFCVSSVFAERYQLRQVHRKHNNTTVHAKAYAYIGADSDELQDHVISMYNLVEDYQQETTVYDYFFYFMDDSKYEIEFTWSFEKGKIEVTYYDPEYFGPGDVIFFTQSTDYNELRQLLEIRTTELLEKY